MNKFSIGLFFFFIYAIGISQETQTKKRSAGFRKQLNAVTKIQINQLKEGALLVRLQTKKNAIAGLRKFGKNKLADEIEKKQAAYNLNIITAFKAHFNFCPTYFFFSDYSANIKERQFDKVVFLNENMLADTSIKFNYTTFLTADFGTIEQDTTTYFSGYTLTPDADWSIRKDKTYYGGPYLGFEAFIIRSDTFIQLRDPFPYFEKTRAAMPTRRVLDAVTKRINKRLYRFYKKKNN